MAEFQEVMQQKKRMCNSFPCCKCDIYRLCGEDLSKCPRFIINNPNKAEKVIMSWAAEHPEPVYPTYGEWFVEHGDLVDGWQNAINATWIANTAIDIFMKPIPADIAQKLEIEPK